MLEKKNLRSVIVTGGTGGIGRSIVSDLSKQYRVYNLDQKSPNARFENEIFLRTDLTSSDSIESSLYPIKKEELIGLVYCAGFGGPFVDISKLTDALWDKIFSINIRGAFLISKEILPYLKTNNFGRIIVIASSQSVVGAKNSVAYASSKHALIGFIKSLADEWGGYGVTANAISPGYVDTAMGVQEKEVPDHLNIILQKTPSKKIAKPEEISRIVNFLIADESGYINGSNIIVDGGITAI